MARVNSARRINIEDVPEEHRSWMEPLITQLNQFSEEVGRALSGGISLENISGELKVLPVTGVGAAGDVSSQKIHWTPRNPRVVAVWIGRVEGTKGEPAVAVPSAPSWRLQNGQIHIDRLGGLGVGLEYRVTFITLSE
jgi:hypothetical protein